MSPEKHCALNLNLTLDTVRVLWADLDDKRRMEVLKSVIWTAPDMHAFHAKALKVLAHPNFLNSLN